MNISKSKYVRFLKCPKAAWLDVHRPDARTLDEGTAARLAEGTEVGDIAKNYFGDYVETTTRTASGDLDVAQMLALTRRYLAEGRENVCEAAFSVDGLYCAVDILHREGNGYAICEVKSSAEVKEHYLVDVAFQKQVLERCGVPVTGASLLLVNKKYVRQGAIDPRELLVRYDVWDEVCDRQRAVPEMSAEARRVLDGEEPATELSEACKGCDYLPYCTRALPQPNVFGMHMSIGKQLEHYRAGRVTRAEVAEVVAKAELKKHPNAVKAADLDAYLDREEVRGFLAGLHYPLCFLDFESMHGVLPPYDGTRPNEVIPFQYSLHVIAREGAPLHHAEFLAESGGDPRRAVAEHLIRDVPAGACVLAYSYGTEKSYVKELASACPDLAPQLMALRDSILDLALPFRKMWCLLPATCGSYSIKEVSPAMFPNDPSLDYHALHGVQNGTEAMSAFPRLAEMPPEEAEKVREALRVYCCLDTLAMVKVWQELRRLVQ